MKERKIWKYIQDQEAKGMAFSKSDKVLKKVRRSGPHMVDLLSNKYETTVVNRTITRLESTLWS